MPKILIKTYRGCWGHTNNLMISAKWCERESKSDCFCLATMAATTFFSVFGISGAQSTHPCLLCTASKAQIQTAPNQQPLISHRTLTNIKADYRKFRQWGKEKQLAHTFNNVCHMPMFDTKPTQVSPPLPSHHAGYYFMILPCSVSSFLSI